MSDISMILCEIGRVNPVSVPVVIDEFNAANEENYDWHSNLNKSLIVYLQPELVNDNRNHQIVFSHSHCLCWHCELNCRFLAWSFCQICLLSALLHKVLNKLATFWLSKLKPSITAQDFVPTRSWNCCCQPWKRNFSFQSYSSVVTSCHIISCSLP